MEQQLSGDTVTESVAPPSDVATYTEGRDTPAASTTNDDDKKEISLGEYKAELRQRREESEQRAKAKAEVDAMTPEQRESFSRDVPNPLYWGDRIGEPDAPKPPANIDDEIAELEIRLDSLPESDRKYGVARLAELKRERLETQRVASVAALEEMKQKHLAEAADLQARTNRAEILANDVEARLAHAFPEVTSLEALTELQRTDPMRAQQYLAARAQAELSLSVQQQQLQEIQQWQAQQEAFRVHGEDQLFNRMIAADHPEMLDDKGRVKMEVAEGVRQYADSLGISKQELLAWYQQPANRDHRVQAMLFHASQYHAAKAKAAAAKKLPMPAVVRPGLPGNSPRTHLDNDIADLERLSRGPRGLSVRQAARLNQMKRERDRA